MAELNGGKSAWPALPDGCPPATAVPRTGDFYRFVDGSSADWANHVQTHGEDWCKTKSNRPLCDWHSLSVFTTLEQAEAAKRRVARFRNHRIVRFTMTSAMGVARDDGRDNGHYSWWPQVSGFVPPPEFEEVA